MQKRELQIVTFNNPYPPNYGGAIDMFYKIKALSEIGVEIRLHIFYDDRVDLGDLGKYCKAIELYKRNKSIVKHLCFKPFAVTSRSSAILVENLQKSEAPILFESLRTLYVLKSKKLRHKIVVRCHNIEHDYSWGLYRSERNWIKKMAYLLEGYKFKFFEPILNKANILLPLSYYDFAYFDKHYSVKSWFLPVFQGNTEAKGKYGKGKYALYHGDLAISDNIKSALFIAKIFKGLKYPLIIASSTKNSLLSSFVAECDNISFQLLESENQLDQLITEAHINTLYSFQRSGTKLKVFNALFKGRHCIVNKNMIDDPDILSICNVAESEQEYKKAVKHLFETSYTTSKYRIDALKKYDAKLNAQKLIEAIF